MVWYSSIPENFFSIHVFFQACLTSALQHLAPSKTLSAWRFHVLPMFEETNQVILHLCQNKCKAATYNVTYNTKKM